MPETSLPNRALLKAEAMVDPVQQIFDQDLFLADNKLKVSVDADTITHTVERNAQGESTQHDPGKWDLGVDHLPEITMDELERESFSLDGLGLKLRVSAKRLEFATGALDTAEGVRRLIRAFAESFEGDAFDAHTNTGSIADGGEFDDNFSEGSGGIATSGGHLVYTPDTDKEWDNGGDLVTQLRETATVFKTQGRINSDDGEVDITNNLVAYTDGLTFGEMHEQLLQADVGIMQGDVPQEIRVPSIYNMRIVQADFAIQTDGDMLIVDEGSNPVVGYYHVYNRLRELGYTNLNVEGFPMQQRDVDEDNGDAVVSMVSGSTFANRKPRYQILAHGLLA